MKKALVVGIKNYPSSPLRGCINDASGFASIIETHGDGSPDFDVILEVEHAVIEPYAKAENVAVFKNLQKLQSVGLVVPVDSEYMYFAAMDSKSMLD